jgi:CheY-like chemotaxis protein
MEEAPAPAGRGETILLIEDDLGVRTAVRRILVRLGYGVQDASTVEEALRLAATFASAPALLVTDVVMPGGNGVAAAEQLQRRWTNMPVLFISGYAPDELHRRGIVVRAEHLLEKPITSARLGHAVRRALDAA